MSIYRTHHTKQYVVITNEIAQNNELSLGARGLLVYLLSLPPNWIITQTQLIGTMKEGRTRIEGYFKELQNLGYMHKRYQDFPSRLVYEIFDKPMNEDEFKKFCDECSKSTSPRMHKTSNAENEQLQSTETLPKGKERESTESCPVDIAKALRPTLNLTSFQFENVKEEWLAKQRAAFPHADLTQEMLRAEAWCMNHPSTAKKRKRWDKFLMHWFQIAEEKELAKKNKPPTPSSATPLPPDPFAEHKKYATRVKLALEKHKVRNESRIYKDAFVDRLNDVDMSFHASFPQFKEYIDRKYQIQPGDLDD